MFQIPLSEIPIKHLDAAGQQEFIELTDAILAAKRQDPDANTSKWEQAIETRISDLYGLSADERKLVMEPSN